MANFTTCYQELWKIPSQEIWYSDLTYDWTLSEEINDDDYIVNNVLFTNEVNIVVKNLKLHLAQMVSLTKCRKFPWVLTYHTFF